MKKIILILFLFNSATVFSQVKPDTSWKARLLKVELQLSDIEKKNYENEIATLKDKLDFQQKMAEQSISSISNQLDSASYSLTLFGLLFTIAAIGIGIYVTYVERKIVKIREANQELLVKNQKIKEDIEAVNKLIQSDIYNLFLKIKREESVHILDRLVKVPKDIVNFSFALVSRELQEEDFRKIRQAYLNLGEVQGQFKPEYLVLLFQHFLGQSLNDEKLRKVIADFIPAGIRAAFENDMEKSTSELATFLVDKGIQNYKSEVNQFFKGLTNSEYKKYNAVYRLFFDNLKTRKNRFEIFNVVESTQDKRQAKIEFGKLLQISYSTDNPTESELLVYEELKELSAAQLKDEEDAKQKVEEQKKKREEQKKKQEEQKKKQEERKKKQEEQQKQLAGHK